MSPPRVLAERFELGAAAGAGGMGTVFRARDAVTGAAVALKVLHEGCDTARFEREARLLATLAHPGVVRYVAHGVAPFDGRDAPYLVMEWLEGEDLGQRLGRGPLTGDEAVELGRSIAAALGAAHALGVVHRDVKPSNVFLPAGALASARLLDFGVAFGAGALRTISFSVVGTPGYMSPEQVRGQRDLDARVDVYALGCVLFECLTGRPAFAAEAIPALLAKILLEPSPRLREIVDDALPELDELLHRMLAKDRAERPRDGAAVAEALVAMSPVTRPRASPRAMSAPPPARAQLLSNAEQRVVSVILVADGGVDTAGRTLAVADAAASAMDAIVEAVREFGGRGDRMLDGSIVLTLPHAAVATDPVARAADCALAVLAAARGCRVALATGRAAVTGQLTMGEAIDRAARLLSLARPAAARVRIDDQTAHAIDDRFEVAADADGALLVARRASAGVRLLLGRPTPCVGRNVEIAALEAFVAQCFDDPSAAAALVTGAPGLGKSRLRHELLRRLHTARGPLRTLCAQGDPVGAGGAFGLAAQLVRDAAGIGAAEAPPARRAKLRARIDATVAAPDAARVANFLAEMIGAPSDEPADVQLAAARADRMLMGDQLRRAFCDLVDAELAVGPLLIVLEDLHWGDLPTVALVDLALRRFADRPLAVVAFGRPETDERFPKLWEKHIGHRVELAPLPPRAAGRLVASVLGPNASAAIVDRLVDLAGGNAFFLEELIRSAAAGRVDALPDTALAMIEARLEALDPELRRVLRAASVFGQVFHAAGADALAAGAARALPDLAAQEIVTSVDEGSAVYAFRHALLRQAAYATLTPADAALGHRLAAAWLERIGEGDAMALAEHWERGGEPARAAQLYLRAASQAFEGNDLAAVIDRVDKGLRASPDGPTLGELHGLAAEAHFWRAAYPASCAAARQAIDHATPGDRVWAEALGVFGAAGSSVGGLEALTRDVDRLLQLVEAPDAGPPPPHLLEAAARLGMMFVVAGQRALGERLVRAVEGFRDVAGAHPRVRARLARGRASLALRAGDPALARELLVEAAATLDEIGDQRNATAARSNAAYALLELGAYEDAAREIRELTAVIDAMGLPHLRAGVLQNLGRALAHTEARGTKWSEPSIPGSLRGEAPHREAQDEAAAVLEHAKAEARSYGLVRMLAGAQLYAARAKLDRGDAAGAEPEAIQVLGIPDPLSAHAHALALVSLARLALGRPEEALAAARRGHAILADIGALEEGEGLLRLALAESLLATGAADEAAQALTVARDRLLFRASLIADPVWRKSFLHNVPEHARTFALARLKS